MLGAGLGLLMLAISIIDARHFIIPNALTAAALALALANAGLQDWETVTDGVLGALLRAVVLGAIFLMVGAIYHRIRQRQGIGLGDRSPALRAPGSGDHDPDCRGDRGTRALAGYGLRPSTAARSGQRTGRHSACFAPTIWLCWLLEVTLLAP